MLKHAFKEWAVVCRALGEGRQALILRKGGIAEGPEGFRVEHTRFWLYPTFVHQQRGGTKEEALPLLQRAEADRAAPGTLRLTHFVEVPGVFHVMDLAPALILNHLHVWSEETVRQRFAYRVPGIYVLPARVYRVPEALEIAETADYAGCRSWVELDQALPTDGATPVLDDTTFRDLLQALDRLLNPTAFC
jgi:hypothetical protein